MSCNDTNVAAVKLVFMEKCQVTPEKVRRLYFHPHTDTVINIRTKYTTQIKNRSVTFMQ